MTATKRAIDASDDSLPTPAAQLREQEQSLRKLSQEPANAPAVRAVREAVDGLVEQWQWAADERDAGREIDWVRNAASENELWRIINDHGGSDAFPDEVDRALAAFLWFFPHSTKHRVSKRPNLGPIPEGVRAADAFRWPCWNDSLRARL